LLFTIGKFAIGAYLGRSSATSAFGAAASLVIILLWVYYSAQILLLGAEFTRALVLRSGTRPPVASHARPVMPEERARQGLEPAPQSG
jgi:membrane protein